MVAVMIYNYNGCELHVTFNYNVKRNFTNSKEKIKIKILCSL